MGGLVCGRGSLGVVAGEWAWWREDEMGRIRLRVSIHMWPTIVMDSFPNFHKTR